MHFIKNHFLLSFSCRTQSKTAVTKKAVHISYHISILVLTKAAGRYHSQHKQ